MPVLMKPNAGLPQEKDGKTFYNVGPEAFSAQIAALVPKGLRIMGGCCGTTPSYIAALKKAVGDQIPPMLKKKTRTVIASRGTAL